MKRLQYLGLILCLTNCQHSIERLQNVGQVPSLQDIPPYATTGEENNGVPQPINKDNSLWSPGKRWFLKDTRANKVGDIIKVNIKVSDNAKLENESKRSRQTRESLPLPQVPVVGKILSDITDGGKNLLDIKGGNNNTGTGSINRHEKINTQVAAAIIKILPNGNFIIKGTQEIRVNFEVRQIYISGIVRPEDIGLDNIVDSSKIAELRFSYGGKGHISDVQQPRLGSQLLDIFSPF